MSVDLGGQQGHLRQVFRGKRGRVFPLLPVFLGLVDTGGMELDHLAVDDSRLGEDACCDWPTSKLLLGLAHCHILSR